MPATVTDLTEVSYFNQAGKMAEKRFPSCFLLGWQASVCSKLDHS